MAVAVLTDAVTGDVLDDPYLASDGETYSRATLIAAMAFDPWHLSPVTREVLRDVAFRNCLVGDLLAGAASGTTGPASLTLYDRKAAPAWTDGWEVTWKAPPRMSATHTLIRRRFALPDGEWALTAVVRNDAGGLQWLMHPPAADTMRADILDLASVVGVHKTVCNPWCLTWAVLSTGRTVEEQWVFARTTDDADP